MSGGEGIFGRWPAIRAALIAAVLVVEWVDAVPLPELRERDLRHPVAQLELERWVGILNKIGVEKDKDEVAAIGLRIGAATIAFRKGALAPFGPFKRITGTGQSWGLFAYTDPNPGRLVVSVRARGGSWQQLYSVPEPGGGQLGQRLRYRRLRGVWDDGGDRPRPGKLFNRFATWQAVELMTARPELTQVEVRIDTHEVILPTVEDADLFPPDTRKHARIRRRSKLTEEGLLSVVEAP